MKILIAECKQEISSFNPVLSEYEDFAVFRGAEMMDYHRSVRSEVGGALSVFAARAGVEVIPTYSAWANTSGGTLRASAFERIAAEFLAAVRTAPRADGVYFALHGAMAAESEFDVEGFLLQETRKLLGEAIPIVASLDLHGVLTDRMLQHSDAMVAFHTYPHVDFFETGQRAARVLLRLIAGEARPVQVRVRIPALVRGNELVTESGIFGRFTRRAREMEERGEALSAAVFIGNPFTDVPELCTNIMIAASENKQSDAVRMAAEFWQVREALQSELVPLAESIRIATESNGHIVLVDAADAPSSGASGDSTAILAALLAAGSPRTALIPIVDVSAVETAFKTGVGASINVTIGGSLDPVRFTPVAITARVRLLSDGNFRGESYGEKWFAGRTAVLECGSVTLVVTSRPCNLWDRALFFANGQNPVHFDIVVVKSPHCQHRFFEAYAERVVNVDAPGSTSADLRSLGHRRCARPMFPLDGDFAFDPVATVFRRERER